jgi:ketosteroid isomerase-like protein
MRMERLSSHAMTTILIGALAVPLLFGEARDGRKDAGKAVQTSHDPKTAIQAVLDDQIVAWNHGDLEGFMIGYWNSPDLVYLSNKQVVRGWQTMLDRYRQTFKSSGEAQMGTLELQDTQITLLGKEAALVWGTFRVVNPDGKQRGGLYTLVMRRFPEGWRTVYDRTSTEPLQN